MAEPDNPETPDEASPRPDPAGSDAVLTNLFDWQKRAIIAGVAVVVLAAALVFQNTPGAWQVIGVLLLIGSGYSLWSWFKAQHTVQVRGDVLRIGRPGKVVEVAGRDVTAVKYVMNRESPDFTLVTERGRYTVHTSRLEKGHSTLFTWLRDHAPQAVLDKRSVRIREMLEIRGLMSE